jgi:hypothetical protein
MNPLRIEGATRTLGMPKGWDEDVNGVGAGLPIRDVTENGTQWMVSAWEFTPEEAAAISAGAKLTLWINGTAHPVVGFAVGDAPALAEEPTP